MTFEAITPRFGGGVPEGSIRIFDTTLRDGEQAPGAGLTAAEKLEVARQLARLKVDVIEAGFPSASPGDFEAVRRIAEETRGGIAVAALARCKDGDPQRAVEAIGVAERPHLHLFIATSDIHLKHKLRISREQALSEAVRWVKWARQTLGRYAEIEFSAEDASRTEDAFLLDVYEAVTEAGASTLNIPDTVGYAIPSEFGALVGRVKERIGDAAVISIHCHNDLGLATANTLAAVQAGARQVEVTINGLGERAGNASLEEVVMALRTRPGQFPNLVAGVQTEQITPASRLVSYLTGFAIQPNKAIVGSNAFAHESGIHQDGFLKNPLTYEIMTPQSIGLSGSTLSIGKLSGRRGLQGKLRELGYQVDGDELDELYRVAIALADTKKEVTDADLLALIEQRKAEVPRTIELLGWSISSSSGGHSVGLGVGRGRRRGQGGRLHRQRPGQRAVQGRGRGDHARPRLVPGPHRVRDQGRLRRRRRTGPGPGPRPPLDRRRARGRDRDRPRPVHEHHRGIPRGVPRGRQQAPRGGGGRRRRGLRGRAYRGGSPVTEAAGEGSPPVYRVALIPGDGVGPEVIAGAVSVLEAVGRRFGFGFAWDELIVGGAGIDAYGVAIRPEDVEACRDADAVLLGAVGGPRWDDPDASVRPEQALFALRGGLGLFANLRPITVAPQLIAASPLKPELLEGVDCLILRELTSGLYFGKPSEQRVTPEGRAAIDTLWYTEEEIRRIVTLAFELARTRRRKVTSVDKANVLATSRLWRKVAEEVHADFPDVELEHRLVDSAAMVLAKWPAGFDVLVTENLFGDILSDEAAVIAGSLGLLPSASLGTRTTAHGRHGLYEPIHGSAPDIAGQDLANPLGTILSAAMMLRWSLGQPEAAAAIETAVNDALDDGYRTRDLLPGEGGDEVAVTLVGTREMARVIGERIAI